MELQARRVTRSATFVIFSVIPIASTVYPPTMLYYGPIGASFAAIGLLRLLQMCFYLPIVYHTLENAPRAPRDIPLLLLSFLLLVISAVQLALTPIIGGSSSCDCSWDIYPLWLKMCQAIGNALSACGATIGCLTAMGNFLNNSDKPTTTVCACTLPPQTQCCSGLSGDSLHITASRSRLHQAALAV